MSKCKIMFKKGNIPDSKFNPKSLKQGISTEKEHTNKVCLAKQIAKAHLVENPNYYVLLKKMERRLKK